MGFRGLGSENYGLKSTRTPEVRRKMAVLAFSHGFWALVPTLKGPRTQIVRF